MLHMHAVSVYTPTEHVNTLTYTQHVNIHIHICLH